MLLYAILSIFVTAWTLIPFCQLMAGNAPLAIRAMKDVRPYVEKASDNTLFIFDVDHVLTMPCDSCFQMPTSLRHRAVLKMHFASVSKEERNLMYTLAVMQGEQTLVEPDSIDLLRSIQEAGYRTLALTALHAIEIDGQDTVQWRLDALDRLGISLNDNFPEVGDLSFKEFESHFNGHPTYREGVLFSNSKYDKGSVLKAFLNAIDYRPDHIVFVDDVLENLVDVQSAATELDIPCVALHYTGAYTVDTPHLSAEVVSTRWLDILAQVRRFAAKFREDNILQDEIQLTYSSSAVNLP